MKKTYLIYYFFALILAFSSCNTEQQITNIPSETTAGYSDIKPQLGVFTKKRPATLEEIAALKSKSNLIFARTGCNLDSDAECSSESTQEFLRYVNNCVTYPVPPFGGFNVTTTLAAISYYVDGDGDVNCDNYEDDLQSMINNVISSTGPAYNIKATVNQVSSCRERSSQNFIVFELTLFLP